MKIFDVPDKPIFQIVVCPPIWTDFVMKNTATEISNLFTFKFILLLISVHPYPHLEQTSEIISLPGVSDFLNSCLEEFILRNWLSEFSFAGKVFLSSGEVFVL